MDMVERAKRFELARTGMNRNGSETKNAVYEKTGVPSSALCAYEDPKSTRPLNVDYVIRLSQHYGVAIDWLLGVSDSWSKETDIRAACDATGLNPSAVWALQKLTQDEGSRAFLSAFIASDEFSRMVRAIQGMRREFATETDRGVDYFSAMNRAGGADDCSMREGDLEDLKIWKASRAFEASLRKFRKQDD